MNRRDLLLGGALSFAAAGLSAQAKAQTSRAPQPAPSKGGPGGVYIPSNYGQALEIQFTTSTDLNAFMPPGLTCVDPHKAFIKAERVKLRSPEADQMSAAFTQYNQVCITTMATTPKFGVKQRNILMWEDRTWAIGGAFLAVKRWGDIQMPNVFQIDHDLIGEGGTVPYHVDVWQDNHQLMSFAGVLDGKQRIDRSPYPGFYEGGDPGQILQVLNLDQSSFKRPLHGTGTLQFGDIGNRLSDRKVAPGGTAPFDLSGPPGPGKNWSPTLIKDIQVKGAVLHDFSFNRIRGSEFQLVREALPGNGRSRL